MYSIPGELGRTHAERQAILDSAIGKPAGAVLRAVQAEAPSARTVSQRIHDEANLGPEHLSLQGYNAGTPTRNVPTLDKLADRTGLSSAQITAAQESTAVADAAATYPPGIFVRPGNGFEFTDTSHCSTRQQSAWVVNHYAYCENRTIIMEHKVLKRGVLTTDATLTIQQTLVGYGSAGTRDAQFYNWMHDLTKSGTAITRAKNLTLAIAFKCLNAVPTSAQCRTDVPEIVKSPDLWNGVSTIYNISSSLVGTVDYEKLGYGDFRLEYALYDSGTLVDSDYGQYGTVRCDSAPYLAPTSGCVFSNVIPWFSFSRADPAVEYSAAHIWDAYYNPAVTSPTNPTKVVPGRPDGSTGWLNRTTDSTIRDTNRSVAVSQCLANDPTYAARGLECDEFPFASTYQGASFSANNWSVRPIPALDNSNGGGKLSSFYSADRVLERNAFAVGVS